MSNRRDQRAGGRGQGAANGTGLLPAASCQLPAIFRLLPAACCLLVFFGCQQQMAETGRERPLDASPFFADRRVARPLVPGTVARGTLRADASPYAGTAGGALASHLPMPLTKALLDRGRDRFDVFCSPCHGRLGAGAGAVIQRGMRPPPSYHIQRLREAPIGHFVDVMTNGFGVMPDYAAQVPPGDRWAIAAYIRALQVSQGIPVAELTADERARLDRTK